MVVVVLVVAEVVFVIISSVLTLTSPYKNAKQYQSDFNLSDIYVLYSLIVLNKVVASKSYKQSILHEIIPKVRVSNICVQNPGADGRFVASLNNNIQHEAILMLPGSWSPNCLLSSCHVSATVVHSCP